MVLLGHSVHYSSVAEQCLTLCNHSRVPWPNPRTICWSLLKLMSTNAIHNLILCCPLLLLASVFPSIRVFSNESVLHIRSQSIGASASRSVLQMNIKDWFPLGWTGLISLSPRDSQKSSPTPQFQSINSLVLSFLYGPTLISKHEYWKNQSFVYMDLC